jgi:hypothetical protein
VVGKLLMEKVLNRLLGGEVGFRDQIKAGFLANAKTPPPVFQDGGAAPGCFLSGLEPVRKVWQI